MSPTPRSRRPHQITSHDDVIERNVKLGRKVLQQRWRWYVAPIAQFIERDDGIIIEQQIAPHVILKAPRQRRSAVLLVASQVLEQRTLYGLRPSGHVARQ